MFSPSLAFVWFSSFHLTMYYIILVLDLIYLYNTARSKRLSDFGSSTERECKIERDLVDRSLGSGSGGSALKLMDGNVTMIRYGRKIKCMIPKKSSLWSSCNVPSQRLLLCSKQTNKGTSLSFGPFQKTHPHLCRNLNTPPKPSTASTPSDTSPTQTHLNTQAQSTQPLSQARMCSSQNRNVSLADVEYRI